jgi:general secretion pathway protein K
VNNRKLHPALRLAQHDCSRRGSALLLALWAIVFVSLTVIGVARMVLAGQEESAALSQLFQARQIAHNAALLATHPDIAEGDPILKGTSVLGGTYEVKLVSEGARLNINELLKAEKREVLERLFERWEVPDTEASTAVDSLLDWVDPDPHTRLNGAEEDFYREKSPRSKFPFNRPFATVEEMSFVRGMEAVAAKRPDWQDAFTVWSEGRLDLNDASAELIEAVCDVSEVQAAQLIAVREGMKELPDPKLKRWTGLAEPFRLLGVSVEQAVELEALVTAGSAIWRAESSGTLGGKTATVCLVFRKGNAGNGILHRLEK